MGTGRDEIWEEFDRLGVEEVRKRLAAGVWNEIRTKPAREWLAHQVSLEESADRRGSKALARDANDLAAASNKIARDANSLAEAANNTADEALGESRKNTKIAILALIAAITAIAITSAGMLFK